MRESITEYFTHEEDYQDLEIDQAISHLQAAIRCVTINEEDHSLTDYSQFDKMHQLIRDSYPHLMAGSTFELIGHHSLLITIPGIDPSLKPALFMAHQDVVPVVPGTEDDWQHPAFSGDIENGMIWGRGSLDVKCQVFGTLEATEYLLAHGCSFTRTTYLAFGDDEENLGLGATALAQELLRRGISLEFLMDEGGGGIVSAAPYGAPEHALTEICLMEKGFTNIRVLSRSSGGHSAFPFGGSSLGHVSQAIARIVEHPFEPKLGSVAINAFKYMAPYITEEPLKTLCQDVDKNAQAIADYCYTKPALFPYVTTTIAPTMIKGGSSASNVMPHDVEAIINYRVAQNITCDQVMARAKEAVGDDLNVELSFASKHDPSKVAGIESYGLTKLKETIHRYMDEVIVLPTMTVGGTDARKYEIVCDHCLRYCPFIGEPADVKTGVHGTNERLPLRSFAQGIRIMIHMMEHTVIHP